MSAVLVVDDDPFIRQLIASTLEETARARPAEAGDGLEALEAVEREQPQIVFMDLSMPRMDGLEAVRRVRAAPGKQPTIVMLTAFAGDENARAAEEAGADLFLTKPFSPLELLNLVDELNPR